METTQHELSGQESFAVIQKMINTVKADINDGSFYYLFWGWLVFIASAANFILILIGYENDWLPWMILMPAGGIITMIYSYRVERKRKISTYMDDFLKYVIIAFLVSLFIVLAFIPKLLLNAYPMVMIIYAIWLFVSGGAIQFKPLIIGGIINWMLGIAAFFVSFDMQLLLLATAVFLGYIVPGHILKAKFSHVQRA